jgi:hypothetical protein
MSPIESQTRKTAAKWTRICRPKPDLRKLALCGLLLASWVLVGAYVQAQDAKLPGTEVWRFDKISSLGGHATKDSGIPG